MSKVTCYNEIDLQGKKTDEVAGTLFVLTHSMHFLHLENGT